MMLVADKQVSLVLTGTARAGAENASWASAPRQLCAVCRPRCWTARSMPRRSCANRRYRRDICVYTNRNVTIESLKLNRVPVILRGSLTLAPQDDGANLKSVT